MEYNLNQGQQEAADAFFQFLFTEGKGFIISGPAGVGKTYLMNYIIDSTMLRYHDMCKLLSIDPHYYLVDMTATTNKAADVLAQTTNRPTQTIHSLLNLKVREDFTSGKTFLSKTPSFYVHTNKIIFVDECSMIDSDLFKIIQEGTLDCKIVYVGDHSQLAPVFEKLSPVYNQNYPFYELKQQMRNAGQQALMDVCQQLRETVQTGIFKPIQIVPGVIDYLDGNQMEHEVNTQFAYQTKDKRILAYTNKRVVQFNNHIRAIRTLPDSFQVGELLINNSAAKIGKRMLSVEQEVEILRNKGPDYDEIDGVKLAIDRIDIKTGLNEIFTDVKVATDREHFDQLLKYYKLNKMWPKYYDLKQTYPDLRPRDAATVHKSQGSTYDTVFIDLGNISTCNMLDQTARMLYVAFSRARSRVYLYGELHPKYGGLIHP